MFNYVRCLPILLFITAGSGLMSYLNGIKNKLVPNEFIVSFEYKLSPSPLSDRTNGVVAVRELRRPGCALCDPVRPYSFLCWIYMLIIISNDCSTMNPGPVKFPCGICKRLVKVNYQQAVCCDSCDLWYHTTELHVNVSGSL